MAGLKRPGWQRSGMGHDTSILEADHVDGLNALYENPGDLAGLRYSVCDGRCGCIEFTGMMWMDDDDILRRKTIDSAGSVFLAIEQLYILPAFSVGDRISAG